MIYTVCITTICEYIMVNSVVNHNDTFETMNCMFYAVEQNIKLYK